MLPFSRFTAAVVRRKANDGVVRVVQLRYHTVWSGISSNCLLTYSLQQCGI